MGSGEGFWGPANLGGIGASLLEFFFCPSTTRIRDG